MNKLTSSQFDWLHELYYCNNIKQTYLSPVEQKLVYRVICASEYSNSDQIVLNTIVDYYKERIARNETGFPPWWPYIKVNK